jgi:hypothetical protein
MRMKSLWPGCAALVALVAIARLTFVVRHKSDPDTTTHSAPTPATNNANAPSAAAPVAPPGALHPARPVRPLEAADDHRRTVDHVERMF